MPSVYEECKAFFRKYIYTDTFYQIDLLPSRVKTERIFRSFHFAKEDESNVYKAAKITFNKLEDFQRQYVVPDKRRFYLFVKLNEFILE